MGFPESFLDCAIVQGCENEACPKNMYCCSTHKCGNMCLCKRDPERCNLFCHDGYILGANGCPECACRKKSQNEDIRRKGDYGRQVEGGDYGRQVEGDYGRQVEGGDYGRQVEGGDYGRQVEGGDYGRQARREEKGAPRAD
ncbi:Hypothetical predicted protein [Mytilus galloprovincialis]|nr:Hypothetical predicted protein [Mytilus galloprovincialis]